MSSAFLARCWSQGCLSEELTMLGVNFPHFDCSFFSWRASVQTPPRSHSWPLNKSLPLYELHNSVCPLFGFWDSRFLNCFQYFKKSKRNCICVSAPLANAQQPSLARMTGPAMSPALGDLDPPEKGGTGSFSTTGSIQPSLGRQGPRALECAGPAEPTLPGALLTARVGRGGWRCWSSTFNCPKATPGGVAPPLPGHRPVPLCSCP